MGIQGYIPLMQKLMSKVDCAQLSGAHLLVDCNSYIYTALEEYCVRFECKKKSDSEYVTVDTLEGFSAKLIIIFREIIEGMSSGFGAVSTILAFDGVPSTAKLLEQKSRRLAGGKRFVNAAGDLVFSTVWFVPGHPILAALAESCSRAVVIGPEIAGEGEHKLFTYACTNYEASNTPLIFLGNDNDVFLLSLICIARPKWTTELYYANSYTPLKETRQFAFHVNSIVPKLLDRSCAYHIGGSNVLNKRLTLLQFVCLSLMCGNDYLAGPQRAEMETQQFMNILCQACVPFIVLSRDGCDFDYTSIYNTFSNFFAHYKKMFGLEDDLTEHFHGMYTSFCRSTALDEQFWNKSSLYAAVEWFIMLENIFNYYLYVCSPSEHGYNLKSMGQWIYYPYALAPPIWQMFLVATIVPNIKHVYEYPQLLGEAIELDLKQEEDESEEDYRRRLAGERNLPMVYSRDKNDSLGRDIYLEVYMDRQVTARLGEIAHPNMIRSFVGHYYTYTMNPHILDSWLGKIIDNRRYCDKDSHLKLVNSILLKPRSYMKAFPWFYPIVGQDFKVRLPTPLILLVELTKAINCKWSYAKGDIKMPVPREERTADLETIDF